MDVEAFLAASLRRESRWPFSRHTKGTACIGICCRAGRMVQLREICDHPAAWESCESRAAAARTDVSFTVNPTEARAQNLAKTPVAGFQTTLPLPPVFGGVTTVHFCDACQNSVALMPVHTRNLCLDCAVAALDNYTTGTPARSNQVAIVAANKVVSGNAVDVEVSNRLTTQSFTASAIVVQPTPVSPSKCVKTQPDYSAATVPTPPCLTWPPMPPLPPLPSAPALRTSPADQPPQAQYHDPQTSASVMSRSTAQQSEPARERGTANRKRKRETQPFVAGATAAPSSASQGERNEQPTSIPPAPPDTSHVAGVRVGEGPGPISPTPPAPVDAVEIAKSQPHPDTVDDRTSIAQNRTTACDNQNSKK
jgi:hypothetical protein